MKDLIGIQVCIVSPGDVGKWRNIIERYIKEEYECPENVAIQVVRWENDMPTTSNAYPQDVINHELIDTSDILIGMFWTKFGTPTRKHESGTEEEIERQISNNKPVILYFYNGTIDAASLNQRQYSKIKRFKNRYKEKNIYFDFKSKKILIRHLKQDLDYNINLVLKNHHPIKNNSNKLHNKIDIKNDVSTKVVDNWYNNSITDLMNDYCIQRGYKVEFKRNIIFKYNVKHIGMSQETIANEARTYAFNKKYGNYDYSKDIRNYYKDCYLKIRALILEKKENNIHKNSVICVASNYGIELKKIFSPEDEVSLTALDISDVAVKRGKSLFKDINFIIGNMEKPFPINKKFDIYLNLRGIHSNGACANDIVIQSINKLNYGGLAVFSISNGYLVNNGNNEYEIKEGMFDHTSKVFTENRPMELALKVYKIMKRYGYKDCGIRSIDTEILIYGIKKKSEMHKISAYKNDIKD